MFNGRQRRCAALMLIVVVQMLVLAGLPAPVATQGAPAGTLIQAWPLAKGWRFYYAPEEGITNILGRQPQAAE